MQERSAELQSAQGKAAEQDSPARSMASERHGGLTQLAADIAASPRMAAQRKQIGGLPVPRPGRKEKVPVQGKFDGVQLKSSPKKKTAQKMAVQLKGEHKKKPLQKQAAPHGGTGLPGQLKAGIESLSGYSMDDVNVHYNSSKPAQLQALAYAQGSDIHVAPGQEQHLPHEAWHVVQQKQGRVQPTVQAKGVAINDNKALEREADVMGARAASAGRHMPAAQSATAQTKPGGGRSPIQLLTVNYYPNSAATVVGNANVKESNGAIASSVAPADYDSGSGTNNSVRAVSQAATSAFGKLFIAGHMLNNHLGGPGTNQDNITAITSGQNSLHHANLEKYAKAEVRAGNTISYYTVISKRADFYDPSGKSKIAHGLASELKGGYSSSSGKSLGPVVISLGPPSAVKKNETATGATPAGGTTVTLSKADEYAADIAENIVANGLDSGDIANAKKFYGMDAQDLNEVVINVILNKNPNIESLVKRILRWKTDLANHALFGSPIPPVFW